MRSRDGSCSLTRTIYSVILFSSLVYPSWLKALDTKEFLISYRYMVKDALLYNETLYISKSMKKCDGESGNTLMLPNSEDENLKLIIEKNSLLFIDYIHKLGLFVDHKTISTNAQNSSTIILTLKTTCFKVDFNDNFARITPLK